ncbi:MAG: hypothetical protein A2750_03395 [Candidatus Yanofskybacteria bacterium RIFCSPHIGHO2_01_FULL_45_42]|uniref:GGDEF domain-containing protein n=3 Tax=Candidatus Yanofskyibacteriota TaxID=1752733 RepID=A0A1F8H6N2_9BACT|nr:MAG: hypothetical protein A2750_03395 [Candidatus Yanofskybacteria bacterium RIFCSPHIGHO2_01_FULL_45_42]OGN16553.1 MAG: hypothetical protein A3C81_00815 [Candidatus Yanofskybacteria bacterium RIFCSPHIGHO2_02_FULL_46_19]OGN27816.1 MAG: hypothetical protein A3B17_03285 [Candidatus Yanofskybacteria bacterium RIFCSPLOWO2_01_FULL_45_72]OGN32569.1 MAG: hypothetical protein A3J01_03195 [Candidatus Yanofskybacteria bacterium RIFCSPLOWO2_02_FULL_45_18]
MDDEENIKKLEVEITRLRKLVYYDELTGLLNRRGFAEEAEREFALISRANGPAEKRTGFVIPFCIIFFDLDNFKKLNDQYGHEAGDEALKLSAKILHGKLRTGDLAGRWGGEEFTVALIGANAERGRVVAEKLRKTFAETGLEYKGQKIEVTGSFGVAEYKNHPSLGDLINDADRAMYTAKESGRNKVVVLGQ